MPAVSPMLSDASSLVIATVGAIVFTSKVMLWSPVFLLPARSVKVSAATETTPLVVLFAVGVNVVVYVVALVAVNSPREPPLTATSSALKSADASESSNVTLAV